MQINENKMSLEMRFLLQQLMSVRKKETSSTMIDIYNENTFESSPQQIQLSETLEVTMSEASNKKCNQIRESNFMPSLHAMNSFSQQRSLLR
jgi:hypothetical protein